MPTVPRQDPALVPPSSSWQPATVDTFNRADTATGGANSTNTGYTDVHGGVWQISGGLLKATADGTDTNQQLRDYLVPIGFTPGREHKVSMVIPAGQLKGGVSPWAILRYQGASGNGYYARVRATSGSTTFIQISKKTTAGGFVPVSFPETTGSNYDDTKDYLFEFWVTDAFDLISTGNAWMGAQLTEVSTNNMVAFTVTATADADMNNALGVPAISVGGTQNGTIFIKSLQLLNSLPELRICRIGDSESTAKTTDPNDPIQNTYDAFVALTQRSAYYLNSAKPGTSTTDWNMAGINTGSNWANGQSVVAAALALGITVFSIQLGTNDAGTGWANSPATYTANQLAIAQYILAQGGTKVIFHCPGFPITGAGSGAFDNNLWQRLVGYKAGLLSICNQSTILAGDMAALELSRRHLEWVNSNDGIHRDINGQHVNSVAWALAEARALGYQF